MSLRTFTASRAVLLTSTAASQTTTVPGGNGKMVVYNAGANPVLLAWAASVAIPAAGTWTDGLLVVSPGATVSTDIPIGGGTLAYIAQTAGGSLWLNTGEGI